MTELPVLPREAACPAAMAVSGACAADQGVVCRAMEQDVERESGVGMSAGALGFMQHEATGGVYLSLRSDPSTVLAFCHGRAVPVLTDDDDKTLARRSYTRCAVWQAERNRILEGRDELAPEMEPEPVSAGLDAASTFDAGDPWEALRRDLALFGEAV